MTGRVITFAGLAGVLLASWLVLPAASQMVLSPAASGGGAPTTATYITQTAATGLSAEQALASLASGLMFVTTTTGAVTSIAPTDDNLVVGSGSAWALKALTVCTGAGKAVTYDTATNAFGCNTISAGGVTIGDTQVAYATAANTLGGDAGLTYVTATDVLSVVGGLNVAPAATALIDLSDITSTELGVMAATGADAGFNYQLRSAGTSNAIPRLAFLRSRGTLGTPTLVSSNDTIGSFDFYGHNGSIWERMGGVNYTALENGDATGTRSNFSLEVSTDTAGSLHSAVNIQANDVVFTTVGGGILNIADASGFFVMDRGTAVMLLTNTGVKLADDGDGALTFLGLGDGSDEDLTFNFDDVADTVGVSSSTGVTSLTFTGVAVTARHVTNGSAPSVANVGANSCGTDAATIAGNDNAFTITVGATAGTQCRVTFTAAAPTRWHCVATNESAAALVRTASVDVSNVDFLGTFGAGALITGVCFPR